MKNKIIISSLIVFVLFSIIVNATSVKVVFDKDSVRKGETITASINIVDVSELHSFQFSLKYDNSMLKLNKVEEGDFLSQGEEGKTYFIVRGNTAAVTTLGSRGRGGSGNLFKASFTTLATGNAKLDLIAGKLVNPSLNLIDFDILPSTITIDRVSVIPRCGDRKCDVIVGESCSSCPVDCGECPSEEPTSILSIIIAAILIAVIALIVVVFRKEEKELINALRRHKAHEPGESGQDLIRLKRYINYCLSQGYSKESVRGVLMRQGWSPKVVEKAFK